MNTLNGLAAVVPVAVDNPFSQSTLVQNSEISEPQFTHEPQDVLALVNPMDDKESSNESFNC